jgi:hypothetical protein
VLRYLKATALGIVAGVVSAVAATWVALQLEMWWQMRQSDSAGGLGAVGVSLGWTLLAAAIGFLAVFFWMLRRSRQTERPASHSGRILKAVGVGLLAGVVLGIVYVEIAGRIGLRQHPDAIMVAVGGAPLLVAVTIGFVVGFVWMMRRSSHSVVR